ncbi:MAG: CpsD/CapB family tyrosine-protein kinase [Clostridium sp.]|uniref:CpsD/CapB family tyrosine-protein kinase n=1 Tax=Clostridium sp. TaxID=1506 RepID=UPI00302526C3
MFIYARMPHSISAESYKSIRTSVKYASIDKPIKILQITSALQGEGKSTVAGNLALSFSETGHKVLVIDCDLRRPSLHRKFGVSNSLGLTDCLMDRTKTAEAIQFYSPRLSVIAAGTIPPNPAEILGSRTFEKFLKDVSADYDYVILDTPPLLAVTDSQLLAGKADGAILVVRYGKTRERHINNAYKELVKVRANVIGSILNGCDMDRRDTYYRYYGESKKTFFKRSKKKEKRYRSIDIQ